MSHLPEKYAKKLAAIDFLDSVESSSSEDLKKKIIECEQKINKIQEEKAADDKLNGAKELVKDYSSAYREAEGLEVAKIKACLWLLESRGSGSEE